MKKYLILLISAFILLSFQSHATHVFGSQLTYKNIGQDSFMVTFYLLRDCNGIDAPDSFGCTVTSLDNNNTKTVIKLVHAAEVDVTPSCNNSCNRCQSHTCNFPYGIEKHTYKALLDLSANGSGFCRFKLGIHAGYRNSSITTGAASQRLYTEAYLNRCTTKQNSSVTYLDDGAEIICVGQDFLKSFGGYDPDGDSIVYEFDKPLSAENTEIPYSGNYQYDKAVYFWGFPNASLPFPRGFHLDQNTGEVSFRPMKTEQTVFTVKASEYRNGKLIGYTRNDIQIVVFNCPDNHAPLISGPYFKEVCANDTLEIEIVTNDYEPGDTIRIFYEGDIKGATWSDNNGLVKHPGGKLTWVPKMDDVSHIPKVFTVMARDDACPVNGFTRRTYQVLVKPPINDTINYSVVDSGCGNYYFTVKPQNNYVKYTWTGYFPDSMTVMDDQFVYNFRKEGIYPYAITASSGGCSSVMVLDTVTIDSLIPFFAEGFIDTVCYGQSSLMQATKTSGFNANTKFLWLDDSNNLIASSDSAYHYFAHTGKIKLIVKGQLKGDYCKDSTEILAIVHALPDIELDTSLLDFCRDAQVYNLNQHVTPTTGIWKDSSGLVVNDTIDPSSSIFDPPGFYNYFYVVTDTQTQCMDSVKLQLRIHPLPEVAFSVDSILGYTPLTVQFTNTSSIIFDKITDWTWEFGDQQQSSLEAPSHTYQDTGTYDVSLTAESNYGCINRETKTNYIRALLTGIIPPDMKGVTVYPNPSSGSIYVETGQFKIKSLVVNHASGKVESHQDWIFENGLLEVRNLTDGLHVVEIHTENGEMLMFKVMIH